MTRIAISGHRDLTEDTVRLVDAAVRREIDKRAGEELVGLSCLADGADSLFARAVLDAGAQLVVVVPAEKYRDGLPASHHAMYDELLARASDVIRLAHVESTPRRIRTRVCGCSARRTTSLLSGTENQPEVMEAPRMLLTQLANAVHP